VREAGVDRRALGDRMVLGLLAVWSFGGPGGMGKRVSRYNKEEVDYNDADFAEDPAVRFAGRHSQFRIVPVYE